LTAAHILVLAENSILVFDLHWLERHRRL